MFHILKRLEKIQPNLKHMSQSRNKHREDKKAPKGGGRKLKIIAKTTII